MISTKRLYDANHSFELWYRRFLFFVCWSLVVPAPVGVSRAGEQDYLEKIKPLLQARCYACHGALKQEAGLRLDTRASMVALDGTEHGESNGVVIPSKPAESVLLARISAEGAERMPPEFEGEALTEGQIAVISQWISDGAVGPADETPEPDPRNHWSFQRIIRSEIPSTKDRWPTSPLDALVADQHHRHGLQPQGDAPRIVLLRRLFFDLVGIPPSQDEIDSFLRSDRPDWYERTVDRLLEDPRYGQRWGRHWMDIWRYSDWWGLGDQLRNSQKHLWHWRDWIVESLNEELPYDEMIRQMLAADEIYPGDLQRLRATGFLARNYFLFNRAQWMEETVEHVSKAMLGLTLNCAKCHDHKYDPISQDDFYKLRAFFEPYHVRLDLVPGEVDLNRDGVPRAFDGLPDVPTYRYIRGDERMPDTSRVIAPGVPDILAFEQLTIQPVHLPPPAWQPQRQPWIIDAQIQAAEQRLVAAQANVVQNEARLAQLCKTEAELRRAQAEQAPKTVSATTLVLGSIEENFEHFDDHRWKTFGGVWTHTPGALTQSGMVPNARAVLKLLQEVPADFDATLEFTIQGGEIWKSVGLSFDATAADPSAGIGTEDSEQNVYVSAYAEGSKVHAAYQLAGAWHYPDGDAFRPLPITVGERYKLRVQVRGQLLNASLDDQPVLAVNLVVPRKPGSMMITFFDAQAVLHHFRLSALDPTLELRPPSSLIRSDEAPTSLPAAEVAVQRARWQLRIALAAQEAAQLEKASTEARAHAFRSLWAKEKLPSPVSEAAVEPEVAFVDQQRELAIRAERKWRAAEAALKVAENEMALAMAAGNAVAEAEKMLTSSQKTLADANAAIESLIESTEMMTPFVGAVWTPTRFLSSGVDDPQVSFPSTSTGRRSALASWLTDSANPLAARVVVNHLWNRHFGRPLVATEFDFGRKGTIPTHPELLDFLAYEMIENGWSLKHIHRLLVTSRVYRLSSSAADNDAARGQDPDNIYWWRREPLRVESQVIRDALLALAGQLDEQHGGPSVPNAQQENSRRRSLYFFHSNNERNQFLSVFDEALVTACYRREASIVPQQALALSNSSIALDACERIAERLTLGTYASDDQLIATAFQFILGIEASEDEIIAAREALDQWRAVEGMPTEKAVAQLVWVLINHNDFVVLR